MNIKLNFFTSTGNTLYLTEVLQDAFQAAGHTVELFDSVLDTHRGVVDCDLIGIVYPVWGSTLPNPLQDLIAAMPPGEGRNLILIGNAGAFSGDTGIHWKNVIESKGYHVIYADHVFLPINCVFPGFSVFPTPRAAKVQRMRLKAEKRARRMVAEILQGRSRYRGRSLLAKWGGGGQRNAFAPVVHRMKSTMFIDQKACTRCGLCHRICPTRAISKHDDASFHLDTDTCILCLKCYNFCPVTAALMKRQSADTRKFTRYRGLKGTKPLIYR